MCVSELALPDTGAGSDRDGLLVCLNWKPPRLDETAAEPGQCLDFGILRPSACSHGVECCLHSGVIRHTGAGSDRNGLLVCLNWKPLRLDEIAAEAGSCLDFGILQPRARSH